jgi:NAD-dependent histone deacetylase SIR2
MAARIITKRLTAGRGKRQRINTNASPTSLIPCATKSVGAKTTAHQTKKNGNKKITSNNNVSKENITDPNIVETNVTVSDISDESSTDELSPPSCVPNLKLQAKYRNFLKTQGIMKFLHRYIPAQMNKREIFELLINLGYLFDIEKYNELTAKELAGELCDMILSDIELNLTIPNITLKSKPRYNMDRFLQDLTLAKRILVITGAGISTSLGIPDFRSFKGLYSQLSHLHLKDPQHAFNIKTFNRNPNIFFSIAHLILPPNGKFTPTHAFIKTLQDKDKLLRNYSQNIDNLEHKAGIHKDKLIQCHGSFGTAKCITCSNKFAGSKIYRHIQCQLVPRCSNCYDSIKLNDEVSINYGVIKPDITFFGEDLPTRYYKHIKSDISKCDMVIVIGTSLKVEPVASIIDKVARKVPRILINRDLIPDRDFTLSLLGDCDDICTFVSQQLGNNWKLTNKEQIQYVCEDEDPDENIYKIQQVHTL